MPARDVSAEEIATARREVHRTLGGDLERKASDGFCLGVQRRAARAGFGPEAAPAGGGTAVASVVEFTGAGRAPAPADVTALPGWAEAAAAVAAMGGAAAGRLRLATALRQAVIATVRQDGYATVGRVYDEVERLSGGSLRPGPEVLGAPEVPTLVTQVCWLNRTMRTWAGPAVLADVAADDSVAGIDVPRRLMPDATPPNHAAIALPAYLAKRPSTGDGVTVAVIDSEVAFSHPALAGRVVHRRNYTAEPWGNPDHHGTAVAGIIAGDDADHAGIAPAAVVYNYKVLATNRFLNGDDFAGAIALQQALEDGADVANCSWGAGPVGPEPSREARAVDAAWAAGMAVVKSAGNLGPGPQTMTTPAEARGIIVVGATDVDGRDVQPYSSRGAAGARPGPDVVAPGGSDQVSLNCCLTNGGFGDAGVGTSFAAPHVTGLLALFLAEDPTLLPDRLRDRLRAHARRLPGLADRDQGHGLALAG